MEGNGVGEITSLTSDATPTGCACCLVDAGEVNVS